MSFRWNFLSMQCPVYKKSCRCNIHFIKCPVFAMSCLCYDVLLFMKCPWQCNVFYEMFCLCNALFLKCPFYEMKCDVNAIDCLWYVLSMQCPVIYEMSMAMQCFLWNVLSLQCPFVYEMSMAMQCFFMKCSVYAMFFLWNEMQCTFMIQCPEYEIFCKCKEFGCKKNRIHIRVEFTGKKV